MSKKFFTLCIVHQDNRVLLGFKKRGFGVGRWNGFGGKIHAGETVEQAAERELEEESGVIPEKLKRRGTLFFTFENDPDELEVALFSIKEFSGEPRETEEMRPQWFGIDEIPFAEMWPDDIYWFPLFLSGKNFRARFHFKDQNTILNYKIDVIS